MIKSTAYAVQRAVRYIQDHFETIQAVCEIADGIDASYESLRKSFAREIGTPLQGYLHKVRVEKARELYRKSGMKLYAIARTVGYTNEESLRRQWKKLIGHCPSDEKVLDR